MGDEVTTGARRPDLTYSRRRDVLWRSTSAGPLLLAPDWDQPRLLASTAALVWEVLDTALDHERLGTEVRSLVERPGPVEAALDELVELGVVEAQG